MPVGGPDPSRIIGHRFPAAAGTSLQGVRVRFPSDLAGRPAVLLVAYRRGSQEDIDRWVAFLGWEAPELIVYEVPVIPSLVWRPLAGWIDAGMRGGVPRESWARVVTIYEEGAAVRDFLGDWGGEVAHVVLLDEGGNVAWFWAYGFQDESAQRLLAALGELGGHAEDG
jgi:hypothetical protein